MSKLLLIMSGIIFAALLSCSNSSNNATGPSLTSDSVSKEIMTKVSASTSSLKVNDFKMMAYRQSSMTADNKTTCNYWMNEKTTVTSVSETTIDFDFDRSTGPFSDNSTVCPDQPPQFTPHSSKHWDMKDYVQNKMKALQNDIDSNRYQKMPWVASASITKSQEVKELGLRAQLIELNVLGKDGVTCTYSHYFSLESMFLGRIEETRICGAKGPTSYQKLVDFSIANVSKSVEK